MVTLGVPLVTDLRNRKSSSWIGFTCLSLPVTCSTGGAKSTSPTAPRNLTAMPPRTSTPSSCSRKSMWKKVRRNSPSVMPCRPQSSCILTTSRIAPSSTWRSAAASISPFFLRARASSSSLGRRKLPTWSARKGGVVRWVIVYSLRSLNEKSAHFMRAILVVVALLALLGMAPPALSQYPSKPIRLVVGFAPGGAADAVSRAIGDPLGRLLGQSIIIDNRPGNGSSLAAELVAKAPADGYTMLIASPSSQLVNPAINKNLGYVPERDFLPITKVTSSPLVVAVHPSLPVHTIPELIAYAKRMPGKLNYGSSGNGSAPHLGAILFSRVAGIEMVHVPYKGGGPAVQALLAGDVQISFATPPSVLPLVQAGRLRGLAVTTR